MGIRTRLFWVLAILIGVSGLMGCGEKEKFYPESYFADRKDKLLTASENGQVETVKKLLEEGVDVNSTATNGFSPLCLASSQGHVEIVKLLLENGADVNATTNDGVPPLFIASTKGHVDIVKLLLENGADVNAGVRRVI